MGRFDGRIAVQWIGEYKGDLAAVEERARSPLLGIEGTGDITIECVGTGGLLRVGGAWMHSTPNRNYLPEVRAALREAGVPLQE